MLLVNPRYHGRFEQEAVRLVKSGVRVGMMWIGPEDQRVHCHVCDKNFDKPIFSDGFKDLMGECPHCHTKFIFAKV